jgi:hypothetical protein
MTEADWRTLRPGDVVEIHWPPLDGCYGPPASMFHARAVVTDEIDHEEDTVYLRPTSIMLCAGVGGAVEAWRHDYSWTWEAVTLVHRRENPEDPT